MEEEVRLISSLVPTGMDLAQTCRQRQVFPTVGYFLLWTTMSITKGRRGMPVPLPFDTATDRKGNINVSRLNQDWKRGQCHTRLMAPISMPSSKSNQRNYRLNRSFSASGLQSLAMRNSKLKDRFDS